MSDLLIHSMSEFAALIEPCLDQADVRNIAEIGSEFGGMSRILADHSERAGGQLTCIDPEPKPEFIDWVGENAHIAHIAKPSLAALPDVRDIDAWVIDGDHNYYTVSEELRALDAACSRDEKPLLAFLHDVGWPSARRDMYYAPDRIPEHARHPHSFDHGVLPGDRDAHPGRGMRGMGQFAWALHEGGERNGVLTAVEDFLAQADRAERPLYFVQVPAVFGLGVIFDAGARWAQDIAQFLLPFHQNPLIARLEENRLQNWLTVIDLQDGAPPSD